MNPQRFLHDKYRDLQQSPTVESAVERKRRKGDSVDNSPESRISSYLERVDAFLSSGSERKRAFLKERILDAAVPLRHISDAEVPDSFFEVDRRVAREQGHGNIKITEEMRQQIIESVRKDQEASIGQWIDYLSSSDSVYPTWVKYWALRSLSNLAEFDKEKKEFKKRSTFTRSVFPDLNREALALVCDVIQKRYGKGDIKVNDPDFKKLIEGANFGKLYAYAVEKCTPATEEEKKNVKGEWIKYKKGSDATPLYTSLQGHGTGWCTAGEITAKSQLQRGDFYVYYSNDADGKPTIPRAAIRMEGEKIAEVRGVAFKQNLDPYIGEIVDEKLTDFKDGDMYKKRVADMKLLTQIDHKQQTGAALSSEETLFLYEINRKIEGFGYRRDPRIDEIRKKRNFWRDFAAIGIPEDEINNGNIEDMKDHTKIISGYFMGDSSIRQVTPEDRKAYEEYKSLETLERKQAEGVSFSPENLSLLYNKDFRPNAGLALKLDYKKWADRVKKLRSERNLSADLSILFNCDISKVAIEPSQINENTEVYVGKLEPGIFDLFSKRIRHIYTEYPGDSVQSFPLLLGGKKHLKSLFRDLEGRYPFMRDKKTVGYEKVKKLKTLLEKESSPDYATAHIVVLHPGDIVPASEYVKSDAHYGQKRVPLTALEAHMKEFGLKFADLEAYPQLMLGHVQGAFLIDKDRHEVNDIFDFSTNTGLSGWSIRTPEMNFAPEDRIILARKNLREQIT